MQQIKSICRFVNKYEKKKVLSLQLVGLEPGSLRTQGDKHFTLTTKY